MCLTRNTVGKGILSVMWAPKDKAHKLDWDPDPQRREPAFIRCLSDFRVDVILVLDASFRNKHSREAMGRLSDQRKPGMGPWRLWEPLSCTEQPRTSPNQGHVKESVSRWNCQVRVAETTLRTGDRAVWRGCDPGVRIVPGISSFTVRSAVGAAGAGRTMALQLLSQALETRLASFGGTQLHYAGGCDKHSPPSLLWSSNSIEDLPASRWPQPSMLSIHLQSSFCQLCRPHKSVAMITAHWSLYAGAKAADTLPH